MAKRNIKKPIKTVRVDELTKGMKTDFGFGQVWIFDCPQCGETIRCLESGKEPYEICGCGFAWHIELFATGVKDTSE